MRQRQDDGPGIKAGPCTAIILQKRGVNDAGLSTRVSSNRNGETGIHVPETRFAFRWFANSTGGLSASIDSIEETGFRGVCMISDMGKG
ncbi:hypothetical protein CHL67_08910 [Prosthecochloris sp. GSB1]|nr:hypothetical protein CHL67_08910 [Prosthecochloris sp. GSB1]